MPAIWVPRLPTDPYLFLPDLGERLLVSCAQVGSKVLGLVRADAVMQALAAPAEERRRLPVQRLEALVRQP
jgi:hypothetical protein